MRRREFITLLGTTVAAWPFGAEGQQPAMPVIGFLSSRSPDESKHLVAAFREGLQKSGGYVEGQNVAIEYRWAEGHYDRLPAYAADLVHEKVTVLVTVGGEPSTMAAKAATSTIPIIFTFGGDPVKAGLVASYNRPGGNATGVRVLTTAAESKRLGLLHQAVPGAAVIGALIDPNYSEFEQQSQDVREAARALDRRVEIATPGTAQEFEPRAVVETRKLVAILAAERMSCPAFPPLCVDGIRPIIE
jgi:putative tryptophan/tyrosine transport system substrate-binding protein